MTRQKKKSKVETMCELLGMNANIPTDICFSFSGLIKRGGKTGPHKDGWGISFYEGKGSRTFLDPIPGANSRVAKLVEEYPIKSKIVIGHIRRANRGQVCLENTHPFTRELWGQNWTFAHNGQLKGIKKKTLKHFKPIGTTDSEHAFCWVMDQIKENFNKQPDKRITLIRFINTLCEDLNALGRFNILLSDSQFLYAFCSTNLYWITRKAPFGRASLVDTDWQVDFKKETTPNDIVTVIATKPLTNNEVWQKMLPGHLLAFRNGTTQAF